MSSPMTSLPAGMTEAMVELAVDAAIKRMFVPHELPIDDELRSKIRDTQMACFTAALAGRFVVPREPTEAMSAAFNAACDEHGQVMWRYGWKAILSAIGVDSPAMPDDGYVLVPKEPTKKMLDAACKAMSPGRRPTPDFVSVKNKHAIRYRAMIAAVDGGA